MKVTFYDGNLNKRAITYNWISLLWQPKYNDVGSFQIELQEASELFGVVKTMDYVEYDQDDNIMIVTAIQARDKRIIISGHAASWILSKRVSTEEVKNTNAERAMLGLVSSMAPWPLLFAGDPTGIDDVYSAQVSKTQVLEYCRNIAQKTDIGFRVVKYGRTLKFECYKPLLNEGVRFSAALGNMSGERFMEGEEDFANVAVVAGAGEGDARVIVTVGDLESSGADRREMYIDARDIQPEDGESDEEYRARLMRRGTRKLVEHTKIENTEFLIDDENVSLGDLVRITPTYINAALQARVTSITIKSQNNITTKIVGIGTPVQMSARTRRL